MTRTLGSVLLLLSACAAPTNPSPAPAPGKTPLRKALPAGTVVRLLPIVTTDDKDAAQNHLDALLREALRQSARLDFAAAHEDCPAPWAVAVHFDPLADRMSTTLKSTEAAPLPLASIAGGDPESIDRLAMATRQALGDPIDPQTRSCAKIYSSIPRCITLTERAQERSINNDRMGAIGLLRMARPLDPGCTLTLAALANATLDQGNPIEASRIAREALSFEARLSSTTRHRLARTLLLSEFRAPGRLTRANRKLLELAEATLVERPHDPHPLYSKALAHNHLGEFTHSAPLLRQLRMRWPLNAAVSYHSCLAELATGNPKEGLEVIEAAAPKLPKVTTVLPHALALYYNNRHEDLRQQLATLATDPKIRKTPLLHEVRRMQAAHEILTGNRGQARQRLLEDLEWMRQRPSQFERLSLHLAEEGEVLVRIGHARDLKIPLQALEEIPGSPATFRHALVYLGGLVSVSMTPERAQAAETDLAKNGQIAWASSLKAAAHRERGELNEEMKEWVIAYQSTEAPLVRASLARVLRAAGSDRNADEALQLLKTRLTRLDLLNPGSHPLLNPASALAYLATR